LTGNPIKAHEAEKVGLVSQVVPSEKTVETALALAKKIAALSQPSVILAKECVNSAFESSLQDGVLFERRVFHSTFATVIHSTLLSLNPSSPHLVFKG